MGTSRYKYEKDCPCGKGKLLIESSESDSVWGPYEDHETVLRACTDCRNDKVPKEDSEAEKAAAAEIRRRFLERQWK
jgi:hypothetical protein